VTPPYSQQLLETCYHGYTYFRDFDICNDVTAQFVTVITLNVTNSCYCHQCIFSYICVGVFHFPPYLYAYFLFPHSIFFFIYLMYSTISFLSSFPITFLHMFCCLFNEFCLSFYLFNFFVLFGFLYFFRSYNVIAFTLSFYFSLHFFFAPCCCIPFSSIVS
jgi:hypothetical protein